MTSHTWATAVVMFLANVLPLVGVQIATEDLTQFVQTSINILGPLYLYFRGLYKGYFYAGGTRR